MTSQRKAYRQFQEYIVAAAVMLASLIGCGGALDKAIVAGEVTYDGVPVVNGEIRFYPTAGSTGPVSGAPIVGGRYEATAKGGVPVGTHTVRIQGFRAPAGAGTEGDGITPGGGGGPPVQYIADEFNSKSTLTVVVTGEQSPQVENFLLKP